MIAGETDIQTIYLYDEDGIPLTYASKALLQAAGWDLTWKDNAGVALAIQPTWTLPVAGEASGRHQIAFVGPSGPWTCPVTAPSADHTSSPIEFADEGTAYDIDSVGAQIATSNGVALTPVTVGDAATIYQGDSLVFDFFVSEEALSYLGAGSGAGALAAVTTKLAQIKVDSEDSGDTAMVAVFTNTITSDVAGNRVLRAVLDAFPTSAAPAGLAIPDGAKSLAATAQLRLTNGTKTCIASVIAVTVLWKATTA